MEPALDARERAPVRAWTLAQSGQAPIPGPTAFGNEAGVPLVG
jgi:hypothetical protein